MVPRARAPARCWVLAAGFFMCHLLFETLNEALVSLPDVPHAIILWSVAAQFICCASLPRLLAPQRSACEVDASSALSPLRAWAWYVAIAAMVFVANCMSQHATLYVDFTLKIVAKSSKILPTMLIASVCGNSARYGIFDYAAGALLCVGTALFSYGSGKSPASSNSASGAWFFYGVAALGMSCLFDGLVPNAQQRVMRSGVNAATLMARTNLVGALGSVVSVGLSGNVSSVLAFAREVPHAIILVLGIGLSLAGSVTCYTELIGTAGSVFAVGVGTLRKTASILLSHVLFPGKLFDGRKASGLVLVAVGLLLAERQAMSRRASEECESKAL
ncbi:unnamed protein product [Prorocentrum cordatum]|uniref:Sugar phosphate transporter domain-containing protein n=1 Tax=Prorocentrum cordatum TaxID=2364126 RepID=A0ABN9Q5S5_9DINO|nr:unnamed protein product [Polarella glacialis]